MDGRLEMADDWHSRYNTLAELDRFRASVLDGGREGCYLSVYTGPRGRGKRVDFEVMMDLWELYKVANSHILSEFRNLSKREIDEVSDTVEAKIIDEWVNPWARKCECQDCEAFDALVAANNKKNESDENDNDEEEDEDEDEDEDETTSYQLAVGLR